METVLVTGATGFLGYHVVKQLNERGIRPRVLELRGSNEEPLSHLDVERCAGDLEDPEALDAACTGVDTLLHLAFKVSAGGGKEVAEEMQRVNVEGTERLLDHAAARGVTRVVVGSSALGVGVNRQPTPLDETADWSEHAFPAAYALSRRAAEEKALALATSGFAVVSVSPGFTMGPDDPVGAPANKIIKAVISRKVRFTLPIGFGALDVRDFAAGVLAASERGRSGQRYLLTGHNVTTHDFFGQVARIAGVPAPRLKAPKVLLEAAALAFLTLSEVRGKPAPIDRGLLQLLGRYAWYDTTRARSELGWEPRPLQQTLEDTISWLRDAEEGAASSDTAEARR